MVGFLQTVKQLFKRRFTRFGIPFAILVVGGSFGLREFTKLRYQFARVSTVQPEEMKKHGIDMKKAGEVTIETEFEKVKDLNIDDWEQVRGPRPWEEKIQN